MQTFVFGRVRVRVITDRLLRVEMSPGGQFCDVPTQVVQCRNFCVVEAKVEQKKNTVVVDTGAVRVAVNSRNGRVLYMTDMQGRKLRLSGNLKGTRRTLDMTVGRARLEKGFVARGGAAVWDDTKSLLQSGDGAISPREVQKGYSDRYYFAYGRDYRACMRDFYRLCGPLPMVPRWALGNWWSRYKAYTQQEYLNLMDRFAQEGIPLSVATVDMDWHWVDLTRFDALAPQKKQAFWGSGWTGYSWNTELFPDYRQFLRDLHARGLKVTLNLHPADGIRAFEDCYPVVAKAMGVDSSTQEAIQFDLTDETFRKAYFEQVHHPYEADGVDFWWIDWQQGRQSRLPGLDPLWALNHYHYHDNARNGEGLILSRYAGPGSHRYPLGFSGDTMANWASYRFQPYFTATAANVGYGWWSHDIGGHHFGRKDDELYIRWLQFGVFSPINRLHSTSNEFGGKEPWLCNDGVYRLTGDFLRLRHRLVPYIYSMAHRAHNDGIALFEPLYYHYPDEPKAYKHKNSYMFGSELLVVPVTSKINSKSQLACAKAWLPPGRWTDIFTGQVYQGGLEHSFYRGLEHIPVLARAGAMLPLAPESTQNGAVPPEVLHLDIWRGNGGFVLHEEDGQTTFTLTEEAGGLRLDISGGRVRSYVVTFRDVQAEPVVLEDVDGTTVRLENIVPLESDVRRALVERISAFQIRTNRKKRVYTKFVQQPGAKIPGRRSFRGCLRELTDMVQ